MHNLSFFAKRPAKSCIGICLARRMNLCYTESGQIMKRGRKSARMERNIMDTSILNTLAQIAPDLMDEVELRALILERVAALEPIGRRALAARLHLAEREVRAAAEALKRAGCLTQSASGMELTTQGQNLVETARAISGGRRTLSGIELTLSQRLNVERVCVVRGDADIDSGVMEEVARAAARQIRFLLQDAHVMAVTGGRTVALTAEAISVAAPRSCPRRAAWAAASARRRIPLPNGLPKSWAGIIAFCICPMG